MPTTLTCALEKLRTGAKISMIPVRFVRLLRTRMPLTEVRKMRGSRGVTLLNCLYQDYICMIKG